MRRTGAVLLATAAFSCPPAHAQTAPASSAASPTASIVEVYLPSCATAPVDTTRLLELLRIELGAIGVSDIRNGGPGVAAAPLDSAVLAGVIVSWSSCDRSAQDVTIEVVDRVTSKTVARRMTIVDVPFEERHRALAIAVAELLQASWAELELLPKKPAAVEVPPELRASIVGRLAPATPAPAPPEPKVHPLPAVATSPKSEGAALEGMGTLRAFPSRNTALLGAAVTLSVPISRLFWAHVGADAGGGDTQVAAGSITTVLTAGSLGISAVTGTTTKLALGPRFSAGYAWGTGTPGGPPAEGLTYSHFVALAALSATLRVPAAGWTALLGIDVGYTLVEASFLVDDTRAAGVGGATFGAGLGAAFGI